jgi:hypothetical protein
VLTALIVKRESATLFFFWVELKKEKKKIG